MLDGQRQAPSLARVVGQLVPLPQRVYGAVMTAITVVTTLNGRNPFLWASVGLAGLLITTVASFYGLQVAAEEERRRRSDPVIFNAILGRFIDLGERLGRAEAPKPEYVEHWRGSARDFLLDAFDYGGWKLFPADGELAAQTDCFRSFLDGSVPRPALRAEFDVERWEWMRTAGDGWSLA